MRRHDDKAGRSTEELRNDAGQQKEHAARWPWIVWTVMTLGLLLWVAVGSVSTISYSYNQFLQMTFRDQQDVSLREIWTYQAENLPEVGQQWLLDAAFVVSVGVILVAVVVGSWLLLVRSTDEPTRNRREVRPTHGAHST